MTIWEAIILPIAAFCQQIYRLRSALFSHTYPSRGREYFPVLLGRPARERVVSDGVFESGSGMFMGATVVCIVVIASDVGNEGNGHGGGSIPGRPPHGDKGSGKGMVDSFVGASEGILGCDVGTGIGMGIAAGGVFGASDDVGAVKDVVGKEVAVVLSSLSCCNKSARFEGRPGIELLDDVETEGDEIWSNTKGRITEPVVMTRGSLSVVEKADRYASCTGSAGLSGIMLGSEYVTSATSFSYSAWICFASLCAPHSGIMGERTDRLTSRGG